MSLHPDCCHGGPSHHHLSLGCGSSSLLGPLPSVYSPPSSQAVLLQLGPISSLLAQNSPGAPSSTWSQTQGLPAVPQAFHNLHPTPSATSYLTCFSPVFILNQPVTPGTLPPQGSCMCFSVQWNAFPSHVHMAPSLLRSAQLSPTLSLP